MRFKNFSTTFFVLVAASSLFVIGCKKEEVKSDVAPTIRVGQQNGDAIDGQYIVVFNDDFAKKEKASLDHAANSYDKRSEVAFAHFSSLMKEDKVDPSGIGFVYSSSVVGFSASLTDAEVNALKHDPRVAFIEQDRVFSINGTYEVESTSAVTSTQTTPWGITYVDGVDNTGVTIIHDGTGKTAWIIDTGIQFDHPDLNVDQSRSVSYITQGKTTLSPYDQNGHGTHVSGTIAAKNNDFGVVGVAAGATVVAVRVLDKSGSGSNSGVIKGVDYVGAHAAAGDVANMSLGGSASTALDNAVSNASSKGIFFAIAAGNSSANAANYSPARVNGTYVYTVSAHDNLGVFASFSNYGNPPVDLCAPGVNVYSTYLGSTYKTLSGTSMATPHVAGLLLLEGSNLKTDGTYGYVSKDPDNNPDPLAHY